MPIKPPTIEELSLRLDLLTKLRANEEFNEIHDKDLEIMIMGVAKLIADPVITDDHDELLHLPPMDFNKC